MKLNLKIIIIKLIIAAALVALQIALLSIYKSADAYVHPVAIIFLLIISFFIISFIWFVMDKLKKQKLIWQIVIFAILITLVSSIMGTASGSGYHSCSYYGVPFVYYSGCIDDTLQQWSETNYLSILKNFALYLAVSAIAVIAYSKIRGKK